MGYLNTARPAAGGGSHVGEIVRSETIGPEFAAEVLASAPTSTSSWSRSVTIDLATPRNFVIKCTSRASTYVGPYTLSGPNPAGGTHSEQVTIGAGGGNFEAKKVYGPAGEVTLSGPGQSSALGAISMDTGRRAGFSQHTVKAFSDHGNAGVCLGVVVATDAQEQDVSLGKGKVYAPVVTGGKGAYEASAEVGFDGNPMTITFLATE